jgi:hypothetical protein
MRRAAPFARKEEFYRKKLPPGAGKPLPFAIHPLNSDTDDASLLVALEDDRALLPIYYYEVIRAVRLKRLILNNDARTNFMARFR